MFPLELYNHIEVASLLVSVACWFRLRHKKYLKWMVPYLLFIVIIELTGRYIGRELKGSVGWIFNFSVPIEYLFFSFLFFVHYKGDAYKIVVKLFLVIFPVFVIINSIAHPIWQFHPIYLKAGSIAMIAFSCFYLADILQDGTVINPLKIPMFWISCGVLLFNTGEFTSNFLMDILFENKPNWSRMFKLINNNLIVVLYSCIIIAIIIASWGRRDKI